MFTREFYHASFVDALVDMYTPIMYDLMILFYNYVCEKDFNEEQCIEAFKTLLKEKTEKVKSDPSEAYSAVIKNHSHEHNRLVSAASINYRRLHSSDSGISVKKLDDTDIFCCVFIAVSKCLNKYPYLLTNQQDPRLETVIEDSIRHGIKQCFKIMFIDDDRIKMIKNLEISKNGRKLPIDTKKLLEVFEREGVNLEDLIEDTASESSSDSDSSTEESESESDDESDTKSDASHRTQIDPISIEPRPKIAMSERGQEAKQIILTI